MQRQIATAGFTLLELLTVIAVSCVLAVAAIPGFIELIRNNRVNSESHALLSLLTLARSEAIKRVQPATLCKSGNSISCSVASEVNWSRGMIIFVDADSDHVLSASETLIRRESSFNPENSISFSAGNTLIYHPNGTSSGGTFTIRSGNVQKKVIVSLAGRARIE